MSKKILSVVLALVLIMSTFVTVAFAATNYETLDESGLSEYTQVWALSEPVANGDNTYTVDVNLTTNYPTGSIQFEIVEDDANDVITLTDVALGAGVPTTYGAELSFDADTGKIIIVPQTVAGTEMITATAINGVVATLTYSYAGSGSAQVAIKNDPKTATTPAGSLIALRMGNSNIVSTDMIAGQSVVDATGAAVTDVSITPVTIGAAAEPAIVVVSGYEDSVVIDTNKTFGGKYAGAIYGFEGTSFRAVTYLKNQLAAENGTLTMTKSSVFTGTASVYGTGATVTLNDASGNAVATYVVIIFGDLDGSGVINATDVNALVAHNKGTSTIAAGPVHMAAQVHCTNAGTGRTININDVNAMVSFNKGTGTIDQAALAAKHVTFTAAANYGSSYVMA